MKVKSVWMNENVSLVEAIVDNLHRRAIVPSYEIVDGDCPLSVIEEGISWGSDFETLISVGPMSITASDELRRRGIWTWKDVMSHPSEVKSAFAAAGLTMMGEFLRSAKGKVNDGRKNNGVEKH